MPLIHLDAIDGVVSPALAKSRLVAVVLIFDVQSTAHVEDERVSDAAVDRVLPQAMLFGVALRLLHRELLLLEGLLRQLDILNHPELFPLLHLVLLLVNHQLLLEGGDLGILL